MIFFFRSPNCTQVKLYGTQVNVLNFLQLHQPKLSLTVSSSLTLLFVSFVAMFLSPGVTRLGDTPAFESVYVCVC